MVMDSVYMSEWHMYKHMQMRACVCVGDSTDSAKPRELTDDKPPTLPHSTLREREKKNTFVRTVFENRLYNYLTGCNESLITLNLITVAGRAFVSPSSLRARDNMALGYCPCY